MKATVLFATLLVMSLASSLSLADAKSDISYRQGVMDVVGGHMKGMGTILRGGVRPEDLQYHAKAMADVAKIVPHIFPAGSGEGKTHALKAIWEQPEDFAAAVDKFVTAAQAMDVAAGTGDMAKIGGAIKQLGGSCKNCHDNFKEE